MSEGRIKRKDANCIDKVVELGEEQVSSWR